MKAPRDLLLLHACTFPGFAALSGADGLDVVPLDGAGRERRPLLDAVRELLDRRGTALDSVRGLLVSVGPGSFTGIRVGIATAQGLAAARAWSVWSLDSLRLYAAPWAGTQAPVAVCHDARRGEVYAALYDAREDAPRSLVPPFCASPEEARARLLEALPEGSPPRWTGSGVSLVHGAGEILAEPSLERLAAAAADLARAGALDAVPAPALEPFYLRRPDVRPPHVAAR